MPILEYVEKRELNQLVKEYLKKNLKIIIKTDEEEGRLKVRVDIELEGERVDYDFDSFYLPSSSYHNE